METVLAQPPPLLVEPDCCQVLVDIMAGLTFQPLT
jgi:hypothetical protein